MKLTIDNYFDQVANYMDIINADKSLTDTHKFIIKATKDGNDFTNYNASEALQETIGIYLEKLTKLKAKAGSKPVAKVKAAPKKAVAKVNTTNGKVPVAKPKIDKKEKEVPEMVAEKVEHIASDIALVKRYINLHDKQKTYDQVLSIWRAFNKAIVERKVTKDSPYKEEISAMNNSLKSAIPAAQGTGSLHMVIAPAKLKAYKAIADSVEKSAGVAILMEFINISGKTGMKERADKLGRRIEKAISSGKLDGDRYLKDIKKAKTEIEAYLNSETDVVNLNAYALNGIGEIGVFGCTCDKELSGFTRSQNAVVYKLILEKVKNLQDAELDRAFNDTIAPSICKTIARKLIDAKQLTMALLRNPTKATGSSLALSGSTHHKSYDIETEMLDMRLRNAGTIATSGAKTKNAGLSGTTPPLSYEEQPSEAKIISAHQLMNEKFRTMGLQGKYRKLIGDPEPGFSTMIYGKPKQGKSTLAIDFAKELTRYGKVLYCAYEEGHGYTLQDKVKRNNANVPNLDFADKLPSNLGLYQFVFVDSVSDAGLDEIAFKNLIKSNKPETSILGVFHATKGGTFRGGQTFAHDVDVLIKIEDGIAYAQGRYAPPNQINIAAIVPESPAVAA